MSKPLTTPKKVFGAGRRQSDRGVRSLTLLFLLLIFGAVAAYVAAGVIASSCWACG